MRFSLLFVCTGNVCRSPLAERLMWVELAAAQVDPAQILVTSAGTKALIGRPMDPGAARVLQDLGGYPDRFTARRLTSGMLRETDLVLTATREHRQAVVRLYPARVRNTFTLREFAALTADLKPEGTSVSERAIALVRMAAARRGLLPPLADAEYDMPDPRGCKAKVYSHVGGLTQRALRPLVATLCPPPLPAPRVVNLPQSTVTGSWTLASPIRSDR